MLKSNLNILKILNTVCRRSGNNKRQISSCFINHSPPTTTTKDNAILEEFSQKFLGSRKVSFTERLNFLDSAKDEAIPIYRIMGIDGKFIDPSLDPNIPKENLVQMYKQVRNLCFTAFY